MGYNDINYYKKRLLISVFILYKNYIKKGIFVNIRTKQVILKMKIYLNY